MRRIWMVVALMGASALLPAQDITPQKLAQFLVLLSGGPIACPNAAVRSTLEGADPKLTLEAGAKVAYATNVAETSRMANEGRTVVVTDRNLLGAGAAVAIVVQGGKATFMVNRKNYRGGFSDQAMKVVFAQ